MPVCYEKQKALIEYYLMVWKFHECDMFSWIEMDSLSNVGEYSFDIFIMCFIWLAQPYLFVFVRWSYIVCCYTRTNVVIEDAGVIYNKEQC